MFDTDKIIRRFGLGPNPMPSFKSTRSPTMPQNQPKAAKAERVRIGEGIKAGTVPVTPLRPNELPPEPTRGRMLGQKPVIADPKSARALGQINPSVESNPNLSRTPSNPNVGAPELKTLEFSPGQNAERLALYQRLKTLQEHADVPGAAEEIKAVKDRMNAVTVARGVPNLTDEAAYLAGQGVNAAGRGIANATTAATNAIGEGIANATPVVQSGVNAAREGLAAATQAASDAIRPNSEPPKASRTPGAAAAPPAEEPNWFKRGINWATGRRPDGTSRVSRTTAGVRNAAGQVVDAAADVATEVGRGATTNDPNRLTPGQTADLGGGTDRASRHAAGVAERKAKKQHREDVKAAKKENGETLRAIRDNPNASAEQVRVADEALRSKDRRVYQGTKAFAGDLYGIAKPVVKGAGAAELAMLAAQYVGDSIAKGPIDAAVDTGTEFGKALTQNPLKPWQDYGGWGGSKEVGLDLVNAIPKTFSKLSKTWGGVGKGTLDNLGLGFDSRDAKGNRTTIEQRVKDEQAQTRLRGIDDFTDWVDSFKPSKQSVMDGYKPPAEVGKPPAPRITPPGAPPAQTPQAQTPSMPPMPEEKKLGSEQPPGPTLPPPVAPMGAPQGSAPPAPGALTGMPEGFRRNINEANKTVTITGPNGEMSYASPNLGQDVPFQTYLDKLKGTTSASGLSNELIAQGNKNISEGRFGDNLFRLPSESAGVGAASTPVSGAPVSQPSGLQRSIGSAPIADDSRTQQEKMAWATASMPVYDKNQPLMVHKNNMQAWALKNGIDYGTLQGKGNGSSSDLTAANLIALERLNMDKEKLGIDKAQFANNLSEKDAEKASKIWADINDTENPEKMKAAYATVTALPPDNPLRAQITNMIMATSQQNTGWFGRVASGANLFQGNPIDALSLTPPDMTGASASKNSLFPNSVTDKNGNLLYDLDGSNPFRDALIRNSVNRQ